MSEFKFTIPQNLITAIQRFASARIKFEHGFFIGCVEYQKLGTIVYTEFPGSHSIMVDAVMFDGSPVRKLLDLESVFADGVAMYNAAAEAVENLLNELHEVSK